MDERKALFVCFLFLGKFHLTFGHKSEWMARKCLLSPFCHLFVTMSRKNRGREKRKFGDKNAIFWGSGSGFLESAFAESCNIFVSSRNSLTLKKNWHMKKNFQHKKDPSSITAAVAYAFFRKGRGYGVWKKKPT